MIFWKSELIKRSRILPKLCVDDDNNCFKLFWYIKDINIKDAEVVAVGLEPVQEISEKLKSPNIYIGDFEIKLCKIFIRVAIILISLECFGGK